MKKYIALTVFCLSIAIAALTGCGINETSGSVPENSTPVSTPESTVDNSESSSQNSTQIGSGNSESLSEAEPELSDDVKRLIEENPCVLEFKGDDGTVLSLSDITHIKPPPPEYIEANYPSTQVTYGLGYMSYALPVFATTLDNDDWKSDGDGFSDAIDWLIYRRDEAEKASVDRDLFVVKPGNVLENGLVVKSAEMVFEAFPSEFLREDPKAEFHPLKSKIEFDGTLTLEGILYKYEGNPQYFSLPNDVFFYPDTTKNEFVPMYQAETTAALLNSDVAVIYDDLYYLGNLDGFGDLNCVDYDVDEILGDKNYARVKITLKNICIGSINPTTQSPQRAEIADVERID